MDEQAGSSRLLSQPGGHDDIVKRLARLQLTLTDLLGPIDDDARRMDASLEDAHSLIEDIRGWARHGLFRPHGRTNFAAFQRSHKALERARVAENDAYEVYSEDLERYQKRRRKDLGVAESDSDRLALVRRRRDYISKVLAFQAKASAILDELR